MSDDCLSTPYADGVTLGPRLDPLGPIYTQVAVAVGSRIVSLNVRDLRAGDVLLFRRPDPVKSPVFLYQSALFAGGAAGWTHCAILDENFSVWDSMPNRDVRQRSLRDVLREQCDLLVVRSSRAIDPVRLRVTLLQFSNHQYRVFRIETGGRLAARLLRAKLPASAGAQDRHTICSLFVADVLRRVCRYPFFRSLPITLPADFLSDPDFARVRLAWHEVEP